MPPPSANPCRWPDHCAPETAAVMLKHVVALANDAHVAGDIDAVLFGRIDGEARRCLDPKLEKAGKHVCLLENPHPCDELQMIKAHAEDPAFPEDPGGKPVTPAGHWVTIAQELESFPLGT